MHSGNQTWIAPLLSEQKKLFNPQKNNILQHCEYDFFLLYENDKIIGRIAVYINHEANQYWKEKIGFFGYYECIDDLEASAKLLNAAQAWLTERKIFIMRGQWNFDTQDIGFIFEGYDLAPVVLSSHNPPYYNEQMTAFGLEKAKDLFVYNCDLASGYKIPQRFVKFTERIAKRYNVTVRNINMKNLAQDALIIVRLTNESLHNNWGFYPIAESDAEQLASDLKMIIHPEAVLIAEVDGKPIGYIIALPDVNLILRGLNGRLFPFGIFKLLFGIKKINRYRIWALGILKEYQQKGISVLLFHRLNEALAHKKPYVEANWVLEDNAIMNNAMKHLQFDLVKKYRIYEKKIG